MSKIPTDDVLESLYKLRIRESEQLKTVLELYDVEIHQKISKPDFQRLKTMVKRSIDHKLRLRNFDARHERIDTGAVVKSRRRLSGIERGKGICYQLTEKGQCSKGDQCSLRHESNDRAIPTPKTAPPSEPPTPRGTSASKKRSHRGRGQSGKSNRQPCKNFLKKVLALNHLVSIGILPNVISISQNRVVNSAQGANLRTGRLRNNQTESRKNGDDKSAVAIVKSVRQLSRVSQDSEPPESFTISRKGTKVL